MTLKQGIYIPLALMTTIFALFFFVFADMGISMLFAYVAMGMLLAVSVSLNPKIYFSRINVAYALLALVSAVFFVLPYSRHEFDVLTVILSIVLCALLSLFSRPSKEELKTILQTITVVGLLVSVYVIIVALFPNIYINYISKFIAQKPRTNTIRMLRMKYGVMLGGNVTLVNHILALSLLILVNKFFIYDAKKGKAWAVIQIFLELCAVFLVNRKGELLVLVLVLAYALCFGGSISRNSRFRKALKYSFIGLVVLIVLILIAVKMGLANRYLRFFFYFSTNNGEEMFSGRLELWKTGLQLFKENPIFGIGWGNTKYHIDMFNTANQTYIENVHCVLLQLLAETGLIGTILYMTPAIYVIRKIKKTINQLRSKPSGNKLPELLASVAFEYQLFLLFNGMIDSTWHRISFWPFYAISIIMATAAQRLAAEYRKSTEVMDAG